MNIVFSNDKSHVIFLPTGIAEVRKLIKFPGFIRFEGQYACPSIPPVVYNLTSRCTKAFKVQIASDVSEWLQQGFKLKPIPESFKYFTKPMDFQEIALKFLYTLGSAGILLEPGMGKTKVVLDYISLMGFELSLIVCPAALRFVWADEVGIHRPDVACYTVKTTDWNSELENISKERIKALADGKRGLMIVINYDKAVILRKNLVSLKIDYIHLDEFLIKDPSTERTKSILEISKTIPYRSGGSGTLVNNTPLDVFSPTKFLQPSLVGYSFSNFRDQYCVMRDFKDQNGVVKTKRPVAFKNQTEIKAILDSCCIVMTKDEWLKLPPKVFHDIYVQMSQEQKDAYYGLMRNYYLNFQGRDFQSDNPLVMMSKLYQISQGFLYWSPTEDIGVEEELDNLLGIYSENKPAKKSSNKNTKNRETLFFNTSPKIDALEKLITTTLQGKKAIIWYNFSAELAMIQKMLDRLSHSYLVIKGGESGIGEKVKAFNKTPSISWLVCQSKSVNYGITVMGSKKEDLERDGVELLPDIDPSVHTEIFFSMSFSSEVCSQQIDRIHRLGQTKECHYYRIFANSPVESKIRQALAYKLDLRREMMVDIAKGILLDESSESSENSIT